MDNAEVAGSPINTSGNLIVDVFQFNRELLGVATKDVPYVEHKHALFNVKAIREEAKELEDQHLKTVVPGVHVEPIVWSDPQSEEARWQTVHSVDANIDAAYFAIGGLARAGLTCEQAVACFMAVDRANKTKKLGNTHRGDMGVPDAAKPADFVPPERLIYEIIYGTKPTLHGE